MTNFLITVLFWMPAILALIAYLVTRRRLQRLRSLFVFDSLVIALDVAICVWFFWREITGHIDPAIWADERTWFPLLVPLWTGLISVPLLILAAMIRYFLFSYAPPEATRAA
jgi:hypothetical protein